jgi:hypothetical protein
MMLTTSRGALFCAFFCLFLSLNVVTLSALRFEEDDLGSKLSSAALVPRSVRLVLAVGAMKCISAREVGRGGRGLGPACTPSRFVKPYSKMISNSGHDECLFLVQRLVSLLDMEGCFPLRVA